MNHILFVVFLLIIGWIFFFAILPVLIVLFSIPASVG